MPPSQTPTLQLPTLPLTVRMAILTTSHLRRRRSLRWRERFAPAPQALSHNQALWTETFNWAEEGEIREDTSTPTESTDQVLLTGGQRTATRISLRSTGTPLRGNPGRPSRLFTMLLSLPL